LFLAAMVRRTGGAASGGPNPTAGATLSGGYVAPTKNFPEAPLKRLYPWSLDNKFGTDIIAGKVESGNGAFKGLILKDAQLCVLKRYLQLAPSYLPESMPSEMQAINDGYPTIVLTRGVYGRELDTSAGPLRNKATEEIWELVRKARQDNPRMMITCIDVPASTTTAEIAKAFEAPLNAYKELAYYDGIWYTPDVKSAANIVKHAKENPRKSLYESRKAKPAAGGSSTFNRKAFEWVKNDLEDSLWTLVWKPVFTDPDYVPPAVNIERLTMDATAPAIAAK
jgi:hypothetical protein